MSETYAWEASSKKNFFGGEALLAIKDISEDMLLEALQAIDMALAFEKETVGKKSYYVAYSDDGIRLVVMHQNMPLEKEEALDAARANYRWPEAAEAAEAHKSHVVVGVGLADDDVTCDVKKIAEMFVKVMVALTKWDEVLALRVCGVLEKPEPYRLLAEKAFEEARFPLLNVLFVGIYSLDGVHVCGYTVGLEPFGQEEIEIAQSKQPAMDVIGFLYDIAGYVIETGKILQEGETVGIDETHRYPITKSSGLTMSGETLKIHF